MESTAKAIHDFALICGDAISANYIRCVSPLDIETTRYIAVDIKKTTDSNLLKREIDRLLPKQYEGFNE